MKYGNEIKDSNQIIKIQTYEKASLQQYKTSNKDVTHTLLRKSEYLEESQIQQQQMKHRLTDSNIVF